MFKSKHNSLFLKSGLMFILLFFLNENISYAQVGKISGRVTDAKTGEPLIGANVVINGTELGSSTDEDGFYFIINVKPGVYSVTTTYLGYQTLTKTNVQVNIDKTTRLNFALKPTELKGSEITVVAKQEVVKKDLTATEKLVSDEQLNRSWARSLPEAIETQTGVFNGHIRGGTLTETVYMLDNISLNSGLISDNYQGINPTTVKEISVLTGGYNAEYGNAMSGIINIVTKSAVSGIHVSLLSRMRPAGKYHWGRNMYSKKNYDWKHFDLSYWTAESKNPDSPYYGQDPNKLLEQWQKQITPDPTQADYTKRAEYETELTIYGSPAPKVGFLISGRYKRGVNIFPQQEKYNPEFNFQGELSYKLTKSIKLKFNALYGGYKTSGLSSSNFNTVETAQEMAWNGLPQITDPYQWNKYKIPGSWASWPELRRVKNFAIKWNHVLSRNTFYEIDVSFLSDLMDKTDRDHVVTGDKWSFDDDEYGMLGFYLTKGFKHWNDKWESKVYSIQGSITSQINKHHLVKSGFVTKSYDFTYDHEMSAYEGGKRWNLMNIYSGKPYEGAFYVQDKIEFAGLIVNAGLRVDFFNQNRSAPKNMFDPLAFEPTTPGHDTNEPAGIPGNPEMEKTKLQLALAPRLGISHPISENTVLHFFYGHFYQRPSWHKMFGFPFINFTEDMNAARNPYAKQETYMDQWMGFLGNPKMGYERTVQYEIGVDNNIRNILRLNITGYYKDASRNTVFREGNLYNPRWGDPNSWTWLYNATNQYNIPIMVSNSAFADIRGIELELQTRFRFPLNFRLSYDLSYATGGVIGFVNLYEARSGVNTPQGFGQLKKAWNSNQKFKGNVFLNLRPGFGPEFIGFKPLSNLFVNLYYEYFSGPQYTYHGPGDTSTEPNNKRWKGHHRWNLKVIKKFEWFGIRPSISVEVRNLFNNKDLNMLFGDDLINYQEKGKLPKHWWSGEPNEWGWYNNFTNPPRQVYVQLKLDF